MEACNFFFLEFTQRTYREGLKYIHVFLYSSNLKNHYFEKVNALKESKEDKKMGRRTTNQMIQVIGS